MIIRCRAPLRLGLAGGGTDVSPFPELFGGCVLNATIDRYVHVSITNAPPGKVMFESGDLGIVDDLEAAGIYPLNSGLSLHRAVYNHFMRTCNDGKPLCVSVHTLAEAPAGSGLGTSSTIVVALCMAFGEYFQVKMDEYELAALAWEIERKHCNFGGGMQDQYSAAFGGVNFMEFMQSGRVLVNPLRVKKWILTEFESSILLYFTGVSRDSDKIISKQIKNMQEADEKALEAGKRLKEEAYAMKASLLRGNFDSLVDSFRAGWETKKKLAREISNSHIEDIYNDAMKAGALAAKISGAGGGGFMMFIVSPSRRQPVIRALSKWGGEMFPAHFTKSGAEAWRR